MFPHTPRPGLIRECLKSLLGIALLALAILVILFVLPDAGLSLPA